jgi:hypothetical protein
MICKTQVIVGTEVDQVIIPALRMHAGALGRLERALLLVKTLLTDIVQLRFHVIDEFVRHKQIPHSTGNQIYPNFGFDIDF